MILVKDIVVEHVNTDSVEIYSHEDDVTIMPSMSIERQPSWTKEYVHGKRFLTTDGKEVCIGMTKKVHDAIGIPLEAFSLLQKQVSDLEHDNRELEEKLLETASELDQIKGSRFTIRKIGLLDRIKIMLGGEPILEFSKDLTRVDLD